MWEGRYRAAPIDSEAYFLACCRYIELNPVRAGMVDHPRAYRWSSYRAHADGAADALLSEHACYRALGRGREVRQKAYRALFRGALDSSFVVNLGTGQGYSVLDVVKAFEAASGKPVPYELVGRRPGDIAECYADPAAAAKLLGWSAEHGIERMCADHWRWQSQNPRGFS